MQTLLVEFCDKNNLTMPSLKYFLVKDAPLENVIQFRLWFVDLWNLVLIEAFREQMENSRLNEDPVKIIARTWPWKEHELEKSLRPLNLNSEDEILNKDPLVRFQIVLLSIYLINDYLIFQMDMLMCLQEATQK